MLNTEDNKTGAACNEALLRSEIGFWREMIDSAEANHSRDSLERMQYALALAETRLSELFECYRATGLDGAERPSNVYHLDPRRRE